MVTLSRTILGFLSFASLPAARAAVVAGATAGFALTVAGTAVGLAAVFAATVRAGAAFLSAAGRVAAGLPAGAVFVALARFVAARARAGVFAGAALAVGGTCAEVGAALAMLLSPCVDVLRKTVHIVYIVFCVPQTRTALAASRKPQAASRKPQAASRSGRQGCGFIGHCR
jgi:hypothetical protein